MSLQYGFHDPFSPTYLPAHSNWPIKVCSVSSIKNRQNGFLKFSFLSLKRDFSSSIPLCSYGESLLFREWPLIFTLIDSILGDVNIHAVEHELAFALNRMDLIIDSLDALLYGMGVGMDGGGGVECEIFKFPLE